MKNPLLIVSMPFKVGIGGYLRSYHVLPKLASLLRDEGYEVELYVPANALRAYITFFLRTKLDEQLSKRYDLLEELFEHALNEINILERRSKYALAVNEKLLKKSIEYNRTFLLREVKQGPLYRVLLSDELRPLLIHFFEKKFVDTIKCSLQRPFYGYSMHETTDAVTALTSLSTKETRVVVLLQLDLGKNVLERMVNIRLFESLHKRTRFAGILSVSPAPISETPKLQHLCNNIRILVPGNALEEGIPRGGKLKKPNSVVYYGRISRDKGIFDLLKAWRIVEKKENAVLYIAGNFEDYRTKSAFEKIIKKYDLKRVMYLGYLEREKLLGNVAHFSVLAYPAFRDSFSMTVLESLAMKLRVVAYDIPALRYIYQGSRNVKLVPVGDFKQLAQNILENLKEPFENDNITTRILNLYSSWETVALKEYSHLNGLLSSWKPYVV